MPRGKPYHSVDGIKIPLRDPHIFDKVYCSDVLMIVVGEAHTVRQRQRSRCPLQYMYRALIPSDAKCSEFGLGRPPVF